MTFGQRLKRLMREKGLNQTQLAEKTGIDRSRVNRIVRDQVTPRVLELTLISKVLGEDPRKIADEEITTPPAPGPHDELLSRMLSAEEERDLAKEDLAIAENRIAEQKRQIVSLQEAIAKLESRLADLNEKAQRAEARASLLRTRAAGLEQELLETRRQRIGWGILGALAAGVAISAASDSDSDGIE